MNVGTKTKRGNDDYGGSLCVLGMGRGGSPQGWGCSRLRLIQGWVLGAGSEFVFNKWSAAACRQSFIARGLLPCQLSTDHQHFSAANIIRGSWRPFYIPEFQRAAFLTIPQLDELAQTIGDNDNITFFRSTK